MIWHSRRTKTRIRYWRRILTLHYGDALVSLLTDRQILKYANGL